MNKLICIFILALVSITAFAFSDPIAEYIEPLPDEEIDTLFRKINNREQIPLRSLLQALKSSQLTLRAYAARELGTYNNETSIPYLIDSLCDDSFHVGINYMYPGMATTRYWANDSLKNLTGEDFGFSWSDAINKRMNAVSRWREWYLVKYGT